MAATGRFFRWSVLSLTVFFVLACNLGNPQGGQSSNPSLEETDIALRVMSTSLAIQQLTLDAAQAQMTEQAGSLPPTQPPPTSTGIPTREIQPSPIPSVTDTRAPAALVLEIRKSVNTFYCYQSPFELIITVQVSDIDRGMSVYYHIKDKASGVTSDGQSVDLHRKTADTRSATIIGGGSSRQNLQFPPLMGESYFIYQIISDDGNYRSPAYNDVTFFPCAQ